MIRMQDASIMSIITVKDAVTTMANAVTMSTTMANVGTTAATVTENLI